MKEPTDTAGSRPPKVRAMLRTLREDLLTARWDPLPKLSRPRWLAWLPHLLIGYVAALFGSVVTAQVNGHYQVDRTLAILLGVLTSVSIVVAMCWPMLGWWLALGAAVAIAVEIHPTVMLGQPWPWIPIGVFAFAPVVLLVALRVPPRVTVGVVTTTLVLSLVGELGFRPPPGQSTLTEAVLVLGVTGVLGYSLRAVRLARGRLVEQETLTEAERAQRTLLEERSRIARELHDVVAHHMSVISIQAQVAVHLAENPSEELKENLAGIRGNALEALTELRRVLGVLRSEHPDDPANPHHPQPTLAELDALVANVRAAGMEVTTEVAGIRRPLSPGLELTAYRVVQEALSNCLRHAPGSRVEVGLVYGPHSLHLCVANSAPTRSASPSPGAGHGLLGMRERAGMLGGDLAAGPRPGGGYEVSVVLPLDPPADALAEESRDRDR
ncbi:sensor histidine kinase [Streptomyces sp. NBC_00536]|uniref:sensor histidine kinase n=1 Tax=Streptomyces sp. NBC_00536 TaxID=2975769 RepID=UPI002E80CB35|nr:sensor histidine kinase [Streptomyces sp. NBC_00536]WUC79880.1 sensor histidine kinase [Streptomyces sp. NBC_00536]